MRRLLLRRMRRAQARAGRTVLLALLQPLWNDRDSFSVQVLPHAWKIGSISSRNWAAVFPWLLARMSASRSRAPRFEVSHWPTSC